MNAKQRRKRDKLINIMKKEFTDLMNEIEEKIEAKIITPENFLKEWRSIKDELKQQTREDRI